MRHGPLPPPQDLSDYERLHPGTAAIIIAMAERQQKHRLESEKLSQISDIEHRAKTLDLQNRNGGRIFASDITGQLLSFVIAAGCVGGALYALTHGADVWAIFAFLGLPVAAIINAMNQRKK
jgi:uncharacterized membrane protein